MSDWREEAACKGHPARFWFPVVIPNLRRQSAPDPYAYGRTICAGCPVAAECLAYALEANEREGLWGGLAPGERHALRKKTRPPRKQPDCGTPRGYKQHRRLGEEACQPCKEANSRKTSEWKAEREERAS